MNRLRLLILVVVVVSAASLAGCGSTPEGITDSPPPIVVKPSVQPLPPEYRVLAETLALGMKSSPDQFRDDMGTAESIASLHSGVIALRGIQSSDTDITYVASQGEEAVSDAVSRFERINSLPKPPDACTQFVTSFIGGFYTGYTGDPSGLAGGFAAGVDAENKWKAIVDELQASIAAIEKLDEIHMMLPMISKKYAAAPSSASGRIVVDIDESWGGFGPNDWLYINNNGPDLEDCTIQVQLTGSTGEVRKNVHFVRHWPANTRMYARYEPGLEILGRQVGKTTVPQIQKADISIWSPQFTTSLTYSYQGAEKDKDIAGRCKKMR